MKVIGVGLNKTGTKTLQHCFEHWGFRHRSYDLDAFQLYRAGRIDELLDSMEEYDAFEDWPWPLIYREIDKRFPDAKFVLTVRDSPQRWYTSLCKMAVRMGPMRDFEKHIYGYSMPHGYKEKHIAFYERHNRDVETYFVERPGKLLRICWEEGDDGRSLAKFLGQEPLPNAPPVSNRSMPVYSGDNLWMAHVHRILFQSKRRIGRIRRRLSKAR